MNQTTFIQELGQGDWTCTAGVDEVGRGPLAGPVVAAAVVCVDTHDLPSGVGDSKRLTPLRRRVLADELMAHPGVEYSFGIVSAAAIDRTNILEATHEAMRTAVSALKCGCDFALVDGLPVRRFPVPHRAIVKGDASSWLIAAASILAKVKRDQIMQEMDVFFPGYGFAFHKGYGTRQHVDMIRRRGVTPIHRQTFAPVKALHYQVQATGSKQLRFNIPTNRTASP